MQYIISASTDVGIKKSTNQDSLSVLKMNSSIGELVFAILCDGMGGLKKGEVASASVIKAFDPWVKDKLGSLLAHGFNSDDIYTQWDDIIRTQNNKIMSFGRNLGVSVGTTIVAALFVGNQYYAVNVGDSRAYEIKAEVRQLTHDHTVVAREIELGMLTKEEAESDPRRNVLLQCIGASDEVQPEFYSGSIEKNAVYMICSDGFIHEITEDEIYDVLQPDKMNDSEGMKTNVDSLIERDKNRKEKDNISVITIRTF